MTVEPHIRPATQEDLPATKALMHAVSRWLISKGVYQWDHGYMPMETLQRRLDCGELYVCVRDGEVVGTLTLLEADPDLWGEDEGGSLYLHTIAIRPDLRGTGLAGWMLAWVEQSARDQGKARVRLDCLAESESLRRYYRKAGYEERGVKPMNPTWRAALFEKPL